jgi:transposase
MQNLNILSIDLAKSVFQVQSNDRFGNKKFSKKIKRSELLDFIANQPRCLIAIEACGGAHYWARQFIALGHEVKIIHPQYVKPFVQLHKNDARDAHAIAEAAARPSMPTVAPKSIDQQDLQALHRIRERLVKEKTAISNELRGLLAEYGLVFSRGAASLLKGVQSALEDATNELSVRGRSLIADLRDQWQERIAQVERYDKELAQLVRKHPVCKQLQSMPGIGPVNATLLYAHMGDHTHFASGRHFSASIGLVPKQHASGGKENLLGISKKGNKHVRKQLVHGARSAYKSLINSDKDSRLAQWVQGMEGKKHPNVIIVALANKLARIAWAIMKNGTEYQA